MTSRELKVSRRAPRRPLRRRFLIYCGGVRTEPDYFEGLRRVPDSQGAAIEIRQKGEALTGLVAAASQYRRDNPDAYDEIWCVTDVDDFKDIPAASREAARAGISVAVSNPCFELWLLLHHADRRAAAHRCAELTTALRRVVPGYDKTRLRFSDFAGYVSVALTRAKALEHDASLGNPSTQVWRLVEHILMPAGEENAP